MTAIYQINDTAEIAAILVKGAIVALPTDTVFGLACIFDNQAAMEKIKSVKGREAHKPLPLVCLDAAMLEKYAEVDEGARRVIAHFLPGALTVVLKKKASLPEYVNEGLKTVAIRIPQQKLILDILRITQKPLLLTSANLSHKPSLSSYEEVYAQFNGRIDALVAQDAAGDVASTIVDLSNGFKILRVGVIKEEEIKEVYTC